MRFKPQPPPTNTKVRLLEEFVKYMEVLEANLKAKILLA